MSDGERKGSIFVFPGNGSWYRVDMPIEEEFSEALHAGDLLAWQSFIELTEKLIHRAIEMGM